MFELAHWQVVADAISRHGSTSVGISFGYPSDKRCLRSCKRPQSIPSPGGQASYSFFHGLLTVKGFWPSGLLSFCRCRPLGTTLLRAKDMHRSRRGLPLTKKNRIRNASHTHSFNFKMTDLLTCWECFQITKSFEGGFFGVLYFFQNRYSLKGNHG